LRNDFINELPHKQTVQDCDFAGFKSESEPIFASYPARETLEKRYEADVIDINPIQKQRP
jgi:hypothetical protein